MKAKKVLTWKLILHEKKYEGMEWIRSPGHSFNKYLLGTSCILGLCWTLGYYDKTDVVSTSWSSGFTVLFRGQHSEQCEHTGLWESGELEADGQGQHPRENGYHHILRTEGSARPSYLATRRQDYSALGENSLC